MSENGGSSTVAAQLLSRPLSSEADEVPERRKVAALYSSSVAIEVDVQRLQLGDVILIDLPGQETKIEAQVVGHSPDVTREIERSDSTVRATLRVPGRDDLVMEWPLDTHVTVVRGP
jgi:hypothetical protein